MRLPPLNALKAFEAAARLGSFARAAEELNVSAGAISRHIKLLEAHLGAPLFERLTQGVRITDAGSRLLASVAEGFETIAKAVAEFHQEPTRLRLVASPTFANRRLIPRLNIRHRFRIVVGVFGGLLAHIIEVWLFGLSYWVMVHWLDWGELTGNATGTLMDCVYFSTSNYTSLGMGDIQPLGPLRFIAGFEALTGLVLITWTASFLFLEMQKIWARTNSR